MKRSTQRHEDVRELTASRWATFRRVKEFGLALDLWKTGFSPDPDAMEREVVEHARWFVQRMLGATDGALIAAVTTTSTVDYLIARLVLYPTSHDERFEVPDAVRMLFESDADRAAMYRHYFRIVDPEGLAQIGAAFEAIRARILEPDDR